MCVFSSLTTVVSLLFILDMSKYKSSMLCYPSTCPLARENSAATSSALIPLSFCFYYYYYLLLAFLPVGVFWEWVVSLSYNDFSALSLALLAIWAKSNSSFELLLVLLSIVVFADMRLSALLRMLTCTLGGSWDRYFMICRTSVLSALSISRTCVAKFKLLLSMLLYGCTLFYMFCGIILGKSMVKSEII